MKLSNLLSFTFILLASFATTVDKTPTGDYYVDLASSWLTFPLVCNSKSQLFEIKEITNNLKRHFDYGTPDATWAVTDVGDIGYEDLYKITFQFKTVPDPSTLDESIKKNGIFTSINVGVFNLGHNFVDHYAISEGKHVSPFKSIFDYSTSIIVRGQKKNDGWYCLPDDLYIYYDLVPGLVNHSWKYNDQFKYFVTDAGSTIAKRTTSKDKNVDSNDKILSNFCWRKPECVTTSITPEPTTTSSVVINLITTTTELITTETYTSKITHTSTDFLTETNYNTITEDVTTVLTNVLSTESIVVLLSTVTDYFTDVVIHTLDDYITSYATTTQTNTHEKQVTATITKTLETAVVETLTTVHTDVVTKTSTHDVTTQVTSTFTDFITEEVVSTIVKGVEVLTTHTDVILTTEVNTIIENPTLTEYSTIVDFVTVEFTNTLTLDATTEVLTTLTNVITTDITETEQVMTTIELTDTAFETITETVVATISEEVLEFSTSTIVDTFTDVTTIIKPMEELTTSTYVHVELITSTSVDFETEETTVTLTNGKTLEELKTITLTTEELEIITETIAVIETCEVIFATTSTITDLITETLTTSIAAEPSTYTGLITDTTGATASTESIETIETIEAVKTDEFTETTETIEATETEEILESSSLELSTSLSENPPYSVYDETTTISTDIVSYIKPSKTQKSVITSVYPETVIFSGDAESETNVYTYTTVHEAPQSDDAGKESPSTKSVHTTTITSHSDAKETLEEGEAKGNDFVTTAIVEQIEEVYREDDTTYTSTIYLTITVDASTEETGDVVETISIPESTRFESTTTQEASSTDEFLITEVPATVFEGRSDKVQVSVAFLFSFILSTLII